MANERITENIVRKHFESFGYELEEQIPKNKKIKKLLQNASKSGDGSGRPEFLLTFDDEELSDLIIVIECKALTKYHASKEGNKFKEYAVDGVLLYSAYLSKEYNVISIAVSGQDEKDLKISTFFQGIKSDYKEVLGDKLLSVDNYIEFYKEEIKREENKRNYEDILGYANELNEELHDLNIKEDKRSLLISGILIALGSDTFNYMDYGKRSSKLEEEANKYKKDKEKYKQKLIIYQEEAKRETKQLTNALLNCIVETLSASDIQKDKIELFKNTFVFLKDLDMEVKQIKKIIHDINSKLRNYIEENSLNNKIQDIISEFYIEFLKYSNSDKSLGIVLTPSHITELFCDLSNLDENDVLIDNCTGTSGFLISAMGRMMEKSKGNIEKIKNIKSKQLIGIEKEGTIYTLAVSNMYLHGDGKSNIFKGDCFDEKIKLEIKENFLPTVGFLNPPYKSKKNAREEMEFILNNLEFLQKGGRCVAIIPMSCVLASSGKGFELKEKLLKKHTLKAVLSMPDELFINSKVGVVTAILVIEAHNPHPKNFKTFFGYFKDDGFVKRKNKGRNDHLDKWKGIKEKWLNLYVNNEIEPGLSTTKIITAKEEWCAEAYLETNYTELTQDEFEQTLRDYLAYLVKIGDLDEND